MSDAGFPKMGVDDARQERGTGSEVGESEMRYSRRHILILSIVLEGSLAATFLVWAHFRDYPWSLIPTLRDFGWSLAACVPLFALNFLLFGPLSHRYSALRSCYDFKEKVVKPLADQLNALDSLLVAVSAGVGEELFFRGVLQNEVGLIVSSALFSVLHFGHSVTKYIFIAFVYGAIGCYFGILYRATETLWVPVLTHAIYDYFALLYMRYYYRSPAVGLGAVTFA